MKSVADKLNWEAFLDALGMKPLSPCTLHRKVAGTVLKLAGTCQHLPAQIVLRVVLLASRFGFETSQRFMLCAGFPYSTLCAIG